MEIIELILLGIVVVVFLGLMAESIRRAFFAMTTGIE